MSSALYYSKELSPEIVQGLKDLGHTNLVQTGSIALPSGIMYVDGLELYGYDVNDNLTALEEFLAS